MRFHRLPCVRSAANTTCPDQGSISGVRSELTGSAVAVFGGAPSVKATGQGVRTATARVASVDHVNLPAGCMSVVSCGLPSIISPFFTGKPEVCGSRLIVVIVNDTFRLPNGCHPPPRLRRVVFVGKEKAPAAGARASRRNNALQFSSLVLNVGRCVG